MFQGLQWRLVVAIIAHSLLAGVTDYCITVLNVPHKPLKNFVSNSLYDRYGIDSKDLIKWIFSGLAAAPIAGAMLGSILLHPLCNRYGPRDTIMIWNNFILISSCSMQLFARPLSSVEILLIGRFSAGVAQGIWSLLPVFLAECGPISCRGLISASTFTGTVLWMLLATIFGLPEVFGTDELWPFLFFVPAIPSVLHLSLTPFFPKSPQFLLLKEKDFEGAVKSVKFYHGPGLETPENIVFDIEKEDLSEKTESRHENQSFKVMEIFRKPNYRWPFLICIACSIAVELGAVNISEQYSTILLHESGMSFRSAKIGTIVTLIPATLLCAISPFLLEKFGRRTILFFGVLCGIVSVSAVFGSHFTKLNGLKNFLAIGGFGLSYIGYYIGPEIVGNILPSEIAPQRIRSFVTGAMSFCGWSTSFVILLSFRVVEGKIGQYSYLPFIVLGIIIFIFLYVYLPETKNRNYSELRSEWNENSLVVDGDVHDTNSLVIA